jgi:hypothetical protein
MQGRLADRVQRRLPDAVQGRPPMQGRLADRVQRRLPDATGGPWMLGWRKRQPVPYRDLMT